MAVSAQVEPGNEGDYDFRKIKVFTRLVVSMREGHMVVTQLLEGLLCMTEGLIRRELGL